MNFQSLCKRIALRVFYGAILFVEREFDVSFSVWSFFSIQIRRFQI